jgi:hypothetical protein
LHPFWAHRRRRKPGKPALNLGSIEVARPLEPRRFLFPARQWISLDPRSHPVSVVLPDNRLLIQTPIVFICMLERLFGEEVRAGMISNPLDISDAWKNSYSCSTNHKVWAAKFTARHPNLVALEVSSFKCGHDAPIYGVIEGIIEQSGTPYFCFKDLDENKPSGSIKIRVETIDYFLRRYREEVIKKRKAMQDIEAQLANYENQLRAQMQQEVREVAAD